MGDKWRTRGYTTPAEVVGDEKRYFIDVAAHGANPAGDPEYWFRDEDQNPFALWISNRSGHEFSRHPFLADAASPIYGANARYVNDILYVMISKDDNFADFAMLANWMTNAETGRVSPIVHRSRRDQVQETLLTFRNACNLAVAEAREREAQDRMLFEIGEGMVARVHNAKNVMSSAGGFAKQIGELVPEFVKNPTGELGEQILRNVGLVNDSVGLSEADCKEIIDKLRCRDYDFSLKLELADLSTMMRNIRTLVVLGLRKEGVECQYAITEEQLFTELNRDVFIKRVINELIENVKKYWRDSSLSIP